MTMTVDEEAVAYYAKYGNELKIMYVECRLGSSSKFYATMVYPSPGGRYNIAKFSGRIGAMPVRQGTEVRDTLRSAEAVAEMAINAKIKSSGYSRALTTSAKILQFCEMTGLSLEGVGERGEPETVAHASFMAALQELIPGAH